MVTVKGKVVDRLLFGWPRLERTYRCVCGTYQHINQGHAHVSSLEGEPIKMEDTWPQWNHKVLVWR